MEQKYQMGNKYGSIMWDIERILKDKDQFIIKEFDVKVLSSNNPFHGNIEYAMSTCVTEPLIVVNLRKNVDKLIDGNHRLQKALKLGGEKISAYYLSYEEHSKYIVEYEEQVYQNVVNHWQAKTGNKM